MQTLKSFYKEISLEAGCDEAGRGCLAGPVFAAAVIFPENYSNDFINDSKKLNELQRLSLREIIINDALYYAIAEVSAAEIDKINILNASILAMHKALDNLSVKPSFIIVDGNRFKQYLNIPHECIVKGDSKYLSIAAASILAKTSRDAYMQKLHEANANYNWAKNKGYPTIEHRKAIQIFGVTKHHRLSFKLSENQLKLNF
ncbi:MAG: ribonuclease HII [Bacteroidetes bacterium GWE2_29_8]|nr:MAG: ribonuclease HII [Bacteroidetes bacterium GWE2_29_8]OFY16433.1 MAG: ribonuclease HII [Bacteroidetes bacterium GWF2_29_10]